MRDHATYLLTFLTYLYLQNGHYLLWTCRVKSGQGFLIFAATEPYYFILPKTDTVEFSALIEQPVKFREGRMCASEATMQKPSENCATTLQTTYNPAAAAAASCLLARHFSTQGLPSLQFLTCIYRAIQQLMIINVTHSTHIRYK